MADAPKKAKKTKKHRKHDRNKDFCKAYRNENKREKNKIVKIKRHMKRFPNDTAVMAHIERCRGIISGANAARKST